MEESEETKLEKLGRMLREAQDKYERASERLARANLFGDWREIENCSGQKEAAWIRYHNVLEEFRAEQRKQRKQ